jgi:tetratricopeptide (TPR) repeat protein
MKRANLFSLLIMSFLLSACETETMRKNEEILRRQQEELSVLRQEVQNWEAKERKEQFTKEDCNRAFLSFEKAPAAKDPRIAVAFYREGLKLCPDDDVAHYELGKILAGMGRSDEARAEFAAALKINPNFQGAKQELEKIQKK